MTVAKTDTTKEVVVKETTGLSIEQAVSEAKKPKSKEQVPTVAVSNMVPDGSFSCPLVIPCKKPSSSLLSSFRLSAWLSEPLKLYSRSRTAQKGL